MKGFERNERVAMHLCLGYNTHGVVYRRTRVIYIMGAKVSTKRTKYSKVEIEPDEEAPLCIPLQLVTSSPQFLKTPEAVVSSLPPSPEVVLCIRKLRIDVTDALEDTGACKLLIIPMEFQNRMVFEDMINFVCDMNPQVKYGLLPLIVIDTLNCLGEDTEKRIGYLRKSCFYAYKKDIPIAVLLNNNTGPAYFSDIMCAAIVKNNDHIPLASITSLPVICDNATTAKKITQSHFFYGINGGGKTAVFNTCGNRRVYTLHNTQCNSVYTNSTGFHHSVSLVSHSHMLAPVFQ